MIPLFAVLASSVGFFLSLGAGTHGWAAWLAPIPLLSVAARDGARQRSLFALGTLAFAAGLGNLVPVYAGALPMPALIASILPLAMLYGAVLALFRWSLPRLPGVLPALLFACAWTALEWLSGRLSPHGSAGAIGYSQVVFAPAAQPARYGGVHLLSFLVCLVPACLVLLPDPRRHRSAALALLAVIALYVVANLPPPAIATPTRRVAVIAGDAHPDAAFVARLGDMASVVSDYRPAIAEASRQGALLAVLPERIALIPEHGEDETLAAWSALAREFHIDLVFGLADGAGTPRHNRAWYIDSSGTRQLDYAKRHLVPGLESSFAPGDPAGATGGMGVAICKDLDFDRTGLEVADRGDALLLAPAWDFVRDAELHARLARTRALEGGFVLVRSARQGLAGVYDSRGRVLTEVASADPAVVRVVDVPLAAERTVYVSAGRHLGAAYLVVALLLLGAALRGRRDP